MSGESQFGYKALYMFGAAGSLFLVIKDIMAMSSETDGSAKANSLQAIMIALASVNFMFWLMYLAVGHVNADMYHIWMSRIFGLTSVMYIILWVCQGVGGLSWLKQDSQWTMGSSWNTWNTFGKMNMAGGIIAVFPYLFVIFHAISGLLKRSPSLSSSSSSYQALPTGSDIAW